MSRSPKERRGTKYPVNTYRNIVEIKRYEDKKTSQAHIISFEINTVNLMLMVNIKLDVRKETA